MKDFKELSEMHAKLVAAYNGGKMKIANSADKMSPLEIRICLEAIADMTENVKLPENRKLILNDVMLEDGSIILTNSKDVTKLSKMRTILAGVMQEADEKEVFDFAMAGNSGHARLRLNMVKNVVAREKAGVDYKPNEEPQGPNM